MPRLIKDPERYKTVLCQKWEACGSCPYKHKCQFAHGVEELRLRSSVCVEVGAPPTLKERATQLCKHLNINPDTSILYAISQASAMLGVRDRVAALATLPEKMELVCTVAKVPGHASPRNVNAGRPASPVTVTASPPTLVVPSPAATALPPPPPSPVEAPRLVPSHTDEPKSLGMLQRQPAEDEEPFYFNARTGKLEARSCTAPVPTREPSHATEMVRRTVSFLFDLDEPGDSVCCGLGAEASIWGAPMAQPWAASSKYGRQAAAGAA